MNEVKGNDMAADWDLDDAMESQLAEWFPNGIAVAETACPATTEDLMDAAMAALLARSE